MTRAESAEDASYKRHNLIVLFIHILMIFVSQRCWVLCVCVFLFFASVWSWENSVPYYSYIAVPTCGKMSCRWCLSLVFHVLHMSIHIQKAHSSSCCTRKTGKCFQMETFSGASIKWSKAAWHLLTFLDCCTGQTSSVLKPPLVFQDSQLRTVHSDCFYWSTCHLVVESLTWWILWEL